jgi:hypothetical protein
LPDHRHQYALWRPAGECADNARCIYFSYLAIIIRNVQVAGGVENDGYRAVYFSRSRWSAITCVPVYTIACNRGYYSRTVNFPDFYVIYKINVSGPINFYITVIYCRSSRSAAIAGRSCRSCTRNGGDDTGCVYFPDPVIVRNIDVAGYIGSYAQDSSELGCRCRAAIAAIAGSARSRKSADDTGRIYFSDDVIIVICEINVSGRVTGYAPRVV